MIIYIMTLFVDSCNYIYAEVLNFISISVNLTVFKYCCIANNYHLNREELFLISSHFYCMICACIRLINMYFLPFTIIRSHDLITS